MTHARSMYMEANIANQNNQHVDGVQEVTKPAIVTRKLYKRGARTAKRTRSTIAQSVVHESKSMRL